MNASSENQGIIFLFQKCQNIVLGTNIRNISEYCYQIKFFFPGKAFFRQDTSHQAKF